MNQEQYEKMVTEMAGDAKRILNDPFIKKWIAHRREQVYGKVRSVSISDPDKVVAAVAELQAFESFVSDMHRPLELEKDMKRIEQDMPDGLSDLI